MSQILLNLFIAVVCTACTYNISLAHTEGTASDVIDDISTPTANTTATIPLKAL